MKVLIIKRYEREFRIPFYQLVKQKLEDKDISIELYYGEPDIKEKKNIKDYIKDESIGKKINNIYLNLPTISLCYQPCLSLCKNADLIIVQQGNRELLNYLILLKRIFSKKIKVAFWGHGRNFQGNPKSKKEKFKMWYSNKVDFWFAYNDLSKNLLVGRGFDTNKIASVNNTIDTEFQIKYFNTITDKEKIILKKSYDISPSDPVGIFCASIYGDKKIEVLLDALQIVKSKIPNIKFFVIGKGVDEFKVVEFSKQNPEWFFYLGNKFNEEKIKYFSISDFQAIPGAVGLNIMDSFSFLCPLITTNIDNHGPEISYLINNENGIMTDLNVNKYANSIIQLLSDNSLKLKLREGCKIARENYSIEKMANNFVSGILKIIH